MTFDQPNNNSTIQLARDFDAEKMRRERELVKQLIESQKLLAEMQQEYANFLKQNPEIAIDIDQYFENKKRLSQNEQNLEENLESLKNENKTAEEVEKQKESTELEELVAQTTEQVAIKLQVKRKELLKLFKPENYQREGLTMEQADVIKSEFNTLWENAKTTGNYFEVEEFLNLVLEKGLKIGFADYKKVNKLELIQRKIAQNNWEAFFIADFLHLFDEFSLPKGANKNMWLDWIKTQETKNSHQKQADLSEQINEQKITNQTVVEQNKVENFRESLIKSEQGITNSESKSQELTFQDIPQTWEKFEKVYDEFLKRYEILEKLEKAKNENNKFTQEEFDGILLRGIKSIKLKLNELEFSTNNDLFKGKNLHIRYPENLVGISIYPETRNINLKSLSVQDNIEDPTIAYLELKEFFAKFGLEF